MKSFCGMSEIFFLFSFFNRYNQIYCHNRQEGARKIPHAATGEWRNK